MEKKRVIKEDGRYLIFYGFERSLPQVHPDQVSEAAELGSGGGCGASPGGPKARGGEPSSAGGRGQGPAAGAGRVSPSV